MNKNQNGFSIIHVLLIVVAVVIIAFIGIKVYLSNHKDAVVNTAKSAQIKASKSPTVQKTPNTIPADYLTFNDTANDFTISYPKNWGNTTTVRPTVGTTVVSTTKLKDLSFTNNMSAATLNGSFIVKSAAKAGFQVSTGKYGATVQATLEHGNYAWKVITANPADTTDIIGSTYQPKLITTNNGLKLYDFSQGDEGASTTIWIMEKDSNYTQITLPTMESPDPYTGGPYASSDVAAYASLGAKILSTITD